MLQYRLTYKTIILFRYIFLIYNKEMVTIIKFLMLQMLTVCESTLTNYPINHGLKYTLVTNVLGVEVM